MNKLIIKNNDCLLSHKILNTLLLKRSISNIPFISNQLRSYLFGDKVNKQHTSDIDKHRIETNLKDLKLPKLFENNIEKHFLKISNDQASGYSNLAAKFCSNGIPSIPSVFQYSPGWTK